MESLDVTQAGPPEQGGTGGFCQLLLYKIKPKLGMSKPASDDNFENQCFNDYEQNSILLYNLSSCFSDNNFKMTNK